jgi:septum formation protein
MVKLYLASKSPRRKQLLLMLIDDFEVIDTDIEETPMQNEDAQDYVLRVAREKAQAARESLDRNAVILSADTEVVFQDQIIGKPEDQVQAVEILQALSGQMHYVYTAVALYTEVIHTVINISKVWFKPLTRKECEEYCRQFNPMDKAGAYGIQDVAAGFITRFEGSYSSVMGLPLNDTRKLLQAAGVVTVNP